MGRWDPRLRGAAYDPDPAPDVDDDPPAVHYAERIRATELELASKACTGDRREAAQRELEQWRRLLADEERGQHWTAGEGDRTLF